MQNVVADLCIESEAATLTALRLARAYDEAASKQQALFKRLGTAVSKYWICKSAVWTVAEALECLGGERLRRGSGLPRLYREMPLNSIWEGSGNVNALDVARAMTQTPATLDAFMAELARRPATTGGWTATSHGSRPSSPTRATSKRAHAASWNAWPSPCRLRFSSATAIPGRRCPSAQRIAGDRGRALGTLPLGIDYRAIVERHRPRLS